MQIYNLVDQNVAKISEWLWMVAVVLALVFPGAGLELAAGFELCLWLSLTPITESCYWEPKSWVPRDPRGIFWQDSGRKHALLTSGMVTGWCVGPALGDRMVPAVHGRSRCGGCLVLFGMNRHL